MARNHYTCPVPNCNETFRARQVFVNAHHRKDHDVPLQKGNAGNLERFHDTVKRQFSAWCVAHGHPADTPFLPPDLNDMSLAQRANQNNKSWDDEGQGEVQGQDDDADAESRVENDGDDDGEGLDDDVLVEGDTYR